MKPMNSADVSIEHVWLGTGTGAALRIRDVQSGVLIERVIGFDSVSQHIGDMMEELRRQVQKSAGTQTA